MSPFTAMLAVLASNAWAHPHERTPVSLESTTAVTVEAPSFAFTAEEVQDTTLVMRRVWAGQGLVDDLGTPTPDGRLLTFVDWSTGNLAIRDMATGEFRNLTHKPISDPGYGEYSVVSPDGKRVAYHWYPGGWVFELHVVDIDGSNDRILVAGEDVQYVAPDAWLPDGSAILARMERGGENAIVLVSLEDGSIRVLKELGSRRGSHASLSPDGRYVVYDLVDPENSHRDIFVLSVDTGRETPLVQNEADDPLFGWVPGSEWVLFGSDRTGALGAWAIRMENGKPAGDPVLVKPDIWRAAPMGFGADGSFWFGVDISTLAMYQASVDPETGATLSAPTRLDVNGRAATSSRRPVWSPDGRYLAYWKTTEPSFSPVLGIRSMETGETRELQMKFRSNCWVRWSPDGLRFLCGGRAPEGVRALYRVDAQTGAATVVRSFEDGGISFWYDWDPDGQSIYYKVDYGENSRIVHLDPATGAERALRSVEQPYWITISLAVSPDGQHIAFWEMDREANRSRLLVMPTAGAAERQVREISSRSGEGRRYPPTFPVQWSRDGRHLLMWVPDQDSDLLRLQRIPIDGGPPERTNFALQGPLRGVGLSPDRRRVVFESGQPGKEIWVMKNYLPRK